MDKIVNTIWLQYEYTLFIKCTLQVAKQRQVSHLLNLILVYNWMSFLNAPHTNFNMLYSSNTKLKLALNNVTIFILPMD